MLAKGNCIPAIRYPLVKKFPNKDITATHDLIDAIKKTASITYTSNYCL